MLCKLNSSVLADCNNAKNAEAMQRGHLIVVLVHFIIVLHIYVSEF